MDWLVQFFINFWTVVKTAFVYCLNGVAYIFSQILYLIFDGLLLVVEGFFTVLDLSGAAFDAVADWSGLPDQLIWIINQVDLPQGFSIIATAIGIRMLINLIPAAVTRV